MRIPAPESGYADIYPAVVRERCGYRQPPTSLDLPMRILDDGDGRRYRQLEAWFRENTGDATDAMTCYIAARFGVMLQTAAILADEFEANTDFGN